MEPSYDNSFNGTNPGGMNPGVGDGAVPQMNANVGGGVVSQMNMDVDGQVMPQMNVGEIGVNQVPQMNRVSQMNPVMQTNPGGMDTMQQMGSETMNPGVMNPMQQMNSNVMNPGGFPGNSMPVSNGMGDVILTGRNKKQSKRWFVFVGVATIIIMLFVVWFFVFSNGRAGFSFKERTEKWNNYYNYLMFGSIEDNTEEKNVNTWYPAIIEKSDDSIDETGYYLELSNKLNSFREVSDEWSSEIDDYFKIMNAFLDYKLLYEIEKSIVEKLLSEGSGSAKASIDEIVNEKNSSTDYMMYYIGRYLDYSLMLSKKYVENGCYDNGTLSFKCTESIDDDSVADIIGFKNEIFEILDYYYNDSFSPFVFNKTIELDKLMEEN